MYCSLDNLQLLITTFHAEQYGRGNRRPVTTIVALSVPQLSFPFTSVSLHVLHKLILTIPDNQLRVPSIYHALKTLRFRDP